MKKKNIGSSFNDFLNEVWKADNIKPRKLINTHKVWNFTFCVLGKTWGPNEHNNGGFIVQWGCDNFGDIDDKMRYGFGETTFVIKKNGTLYVDTESMGREFSKQVLEELSCRSHVDCGDDKKPLRKRGKHGQRDKEML